MTTVGRWSPNKVRERVLNGTWVSPEELGGMVLIAPTSIAYSGTSASVGANGSVEFSAVTSLSLNGVFSADYDNYIVNLTIYQNPGNSIQMRLRASGSDATGSNYVYQTLLANSTSVTGSRATVSDPYVLDAYATYRNAISMNVYGPFLAQPTAFRTVSTVGLSGAGIYDRALTHSLSTSYDGATFYVGSDSFTGSMSVYGLVGA